MNEAVNPFEVLSQLLDQFTIRAELYRDARAAFAEHGEPVDLALAQHHAGGLVGAVIRELGTWAWTLYETAALLPGV